MMSLETRTIDTSSQLLWRCMKVQLVNFCGFYVVFNDSRPFYRWRDKREFNGLTLVLLLLAILGNPESWSCSL